MRTTVVLCTLLLLGCPADPKRDSVQDTGPFSDQDEDGWATGRDCDDRDASIHPEAPEICDGVDNDCDGAVDEEVTVTVWTDADADGFGDPASPVQACAPGDGLVDNAEDCDDTTARVKPGADETCNGRDDDCDGAVDEEPVDGEHLHVDADGDGYGDPARTEVACRPGQGLVIDGTDCHDDDPGAYPGSPSWEWPEDGTDQDCDGFDGTRDLDGDGLTDLFFANYRDDTTYVQSSPVYFGAEDGYAVDRAARLDTRGTLAALAEDLDGDGRPELVVANFYDDTVPTYSLDAWIYWGREGGPSLEHATALPTDGGLDLTSADLDRDGYAELIFSCYYALGSYECPSRVFWSQGGTWSAEASTDLSTTGAYHVEAADLNADGWIDLAFNSRYGPVGYPTEAAVFLNEEGGFASEPTVTLPVTGGSHIAVGDFDADGWPDLALNSFSDESTFELDSPVYIGAAEGYDPDRAWLLATNGAWAMVAKDLDRDGYDDLVVASYRSDASVLTESPVFHGGPEGLSNERCTLLPTAGARDVHATDLDGDGWLDLAFASYYGASGFTSSSEIYWGSAEGYSEEALTTLPTVGAFRVRAGDVDHDGWQDLVYTSFHTGTSYVSEGLVYYGSVGGFAEEHRDVLPVSGAWAWPLLVGAD